MVAPNVVKPSPFYRGGVTKTYWVETIANIASPTRAELNAGDCLSPAVESKSGWTESAAFADVMTEDTRRAAKIAGAVTSADSSITFIKDKDGTANVSDVLAWEIGVTGYIVLLDHGDKPGTPMRVYDVEIGSISTDDSGDKTVETVTFGIRDSELSVTVPAAIP